MKKIWIQCPQCLGHGEVPMPSGLLDALQIVQKHGKGGITAAEIHALCGDFDRVKVTAINNRLTKLQELKLVKQSEKKGKYLIWIPA